jgi:hypothetical protein
LTPLGLKPWRKKIDLIFRLERPQSVKDVRSFIGAVTYYRDMYPHHSNVLAPLTDLTGLNARNLHWSSKHQAAFDAMKALMAQDVLLCYPDHNKFFHIYTDAINLQLGAVIMQDSMPVAFLSRKLNPAQCNYATIEKELLSVVSTLKEFRTMLYGCNELHIHTDHRNLTFNTLNSERVLRWRLFIEEYKPLFHYITLHYIKGEHNVLADALSRLPLKESLRAVPQASYPAEFCSASEPHSHDESESIDLSDTFHAHTFSVATDDDEMLQCFLNHPDMDPEHPINLDYQTIATAQDEDPELRDKLATDEP